MALLGQAARVRATRSRPDAAPAAGIVGPPTLGALFASHHSSPQRNDDGGCGEGRVLGPIGGHAGGCCGARRGTEWIGDRGRCTGRGGGEGGAARQDSVGRRAMRRDRFGGESVVQDGDVLHATGRNGDGRS